MKAKDFRSNAREALRGNWFKACVAGILASMFGGANNYGISFNFGTQVPTEGGEDVTASLLNAAATPGMEASLPFIIGFTISFILVSIIFLFISCAVSVGYCQFNLDLVDGSKLNVGSLFSRFRQAKTAVWANILVAVRILVGLILFVIPGIVMMYSYAMVNFVMAEHPEYTAKEALAESRRIMRGNRWKLFCLELSFIGWMFLSALTFGIALIWVVPYQNAAIASFYREASADTY